VYEDLIFHVNKTLLYNTWNSREKSLKIQKG